ncbi:MAG: SDR family NAD(P)-dependent oxidoreductase [Bacteroidetes bacterium]|nr:SDR family NAD(P)-dependent oxidoreductase [Bacteroidota bacterium]
MAKLQFKDKWVLVTGASAGLGEEIARQLAFKHGANLILLARRKEKLEKLQAELEKAVKVRVIVADLSKLEEVDRAAAEVLSGDQLFAAVLNAGITYFGLHSELEWDYFQTMLQTNVVGVTRMTNRLVDHFEAAGREGGLLIVSSMAAIFPVPYQAAYSGTKSYLLTFATALSHELKNRQFSITVYNPGGIATEMTEGEKFNELRRWLMPVEQAAAEAIQAFQKRKLTHIPGFINRFGSIFLKFLPRKFVMKQMSGVYGKSLFGNSKS